MLNLSGKRDGNNAECQMERRDLIFLSLSHTWYKILERAGSVYRMLAENHIGVGLTCSTISSFANP